VKITSVKTAATSGHCMHLWVRVETDAGVTGLGECVHGGHQAIAIIRDLEARLIGRDPFAIDMIFEDIAPQPRLRGRLRRRADHRAHRHRDRALGPQGQGARRAGLRAHGRQVPRPDPRLCRLRGLARLNFDEIKRVIDEILERGFTALKIDLDIFAYGHTGSETEHYVKDNFNMTPNRWEHDRMVKLAEMVVEAAGPDVEVACDLHTRLDKHSAIRLARDLEHLKLMWLEEPSRPKTSTPCARSRGDHRRRSAPARTSISGTASAS
jgi:L-alanine-DL-glutamate epimerase-like enolase superfamily enzyme